MKYNTRKKAVLILADGTIFHGKAIGSDGTAFGEVCFNTGMTGYQEIFTDPSYYGQLMVTTNPHIGNYGVNLNEMESSSIKINGLICKNFSYNYSRVDAQGSLEDFFITHNLFAISDVDTRALVGYIRDNGAMNAVISTNVNDIESLKKQLSEIPQMEGLELASKVSTNEPYFYGDENATYKVAALDIGIKKNILRNFSERDVFVKVFPYNSTFEELSAWNPDGYFLSNGPGDPEPLLEAQLLAKTIIDNNLPLFGICLGHQVIALANGISTYKMHNGHRGINHPWYAYGLVNCIIIPITIKINEGQKVIIAINPKIIGLGFGSSNIPIFENSIIDNNGPLPIIKIIIPILVSLCSFFIPQI